MPNLSPEKKEEEKLAMIISKAEEKVDYSDNDSKMEALAELAAARNQLAQFYDVEKQFHNAKEQYKESIATYEEAIKLAAKYDSLSSEHIYKELVADSKKSLKRIEENKEGLVKKVSATGTLAASAFGLAGGLALLAPALTGNSIGNLSTETTAFLGAGLLIVGLIAGFFWFKNRK